jgi:hypothetical protein
MRQYEVLQAITFNHGRFKLTPEQFANRRYVVKRIGEPDDELDELIVEPVQEISFKRGEIITTDMEVTRAMEEKLRPLEVKQPSEPAPVSKIDSDATDLSADEGTEGASDEPSADDPLASIPDTPPSMESARVDEASEPTSKRRPRK